MKIKTEKMQYLNIVAVDNFVYMNLLTAEQYCEVIKRYNLLCITGECDNSFDNDIQKQFFEKLLELHLINVEKYKRVQQRGSKGGLKAKENRQKKNKIQVENGETEKPNKKLIDIKTKKPVKGKPFTPPTLAEVEEFCKQRKNNVDPQTFYDYYEVGNWKDSKGNPVKNWKQKLISVWERGDTDKNSKEETKNRTPEEQKAYLEDLLNW